MLSTKFWRWEEVVIPATWVAVLTALGILALWAPSATTPSPSLANMWGTVAVIQLPIIGLIHRFLRRHGTGWAAGFGFRQRLQPPLWVWVLASVTGCVVTLMGVNLALQGLAHQWGWRGQLQSAVLALQSGSPAVKATIAVTAIGLAPVVEEPLFRGILYQSCRDAGHPRMGLLLTSLVFGLVHGNWPTLLPLALFGAYQCWLYERTGNLLACILTHAGFNAVFVGLTLGGFATG